MKGDGINVVRYALTSMRARGVTLSEIADGLGEPEDMVPAGAVTVSRGIPVSAACLVRRPARSRRS